MESVERNIVAQAPWRGDFQADSPIASLIRTRIDKTTDWSSWSSWTLVAATTHTSV